MFGIHLLRFLVFRVGQLDNVLTGPEFGTCPVVDPRHVSVLVAAVGMATTGDATALILFENDEVFLIEVWREHGMDNLLFS